MAQLQGFGIKDFYQTAVTRGFARTNTFRIKNITGVFNGEDSDLLLYAQGGTIPSRSIYYSSVSFKAFEFNVPMSSSYPESTSWALNFYCDSKFVLRNIFESWSRKTFDEHKHISTTTLSDIEFVLLDSQLQEVRNYKLIGTYPTQIGSMSFAVGNAGELATCNVNIAFQYVISDNST